MKLLSVPRVDAVKVMRTQVRRGAGIVQRMDMSTRELHKCACSKGKCVHWHTVGQRAQCRDGHRQGGGTRDFWLDVRSRGNRAPVRSGAVVRAA